MPWYQRKAVQWALFALLLACLLLLLCWKAPYGYGAVDEPFYLTTAQRLAMGDALLCDEWNLSQLSGALLTPAYKLYVALTGGTDGILLAFRYGFIVFKLAVTAGLWLLLRERHGLGALAACAVYALYTPYNLLQLSYNTLAMAALALMAGLLLRLDWARLRPWRLALPAGCLFALAVLCCPHLLLPYAAGLLVCLALWLARRDARFARLALAFTAGCALVAAALAAFTLSRASLPEVLANLRCMLSDPEHGAGDTSVLPLAWAQYPVLRLGLPALLLAMALDALLTRRGGLRRLRLFHAHRANSCPPGGSQEPHALRASACPAGGSRPALTLEPFYLPVAAALVIAELARQAADIQLTYNYLMVPFAALGLVAFLCLCAREGWRGAARPMALWLLAWAYALALRLSSNQRLMAFSSAMALADMATALLLWRYWRLAPKRGLALAAAVLALVCQLGCQGYSVVRHAYWEPSVSAINAEIDRGPLRGVRTTQGHAWQYNVLLVDLAWFEANCEPGPFVYYSLRPEAYLYLGWEYGTFSAWSGQPARQASFDEAYWALHPERRARYVYVEAQYAPDEAALRAAAEAAGYAVTALANGYALVR